MTKSAVIELIGGPSKTRRWKGKDRWIYELHRNDGTVKAEEIHFEGGKVTYVGPSIPPAVSAQEQDRLNESANLKSLGESEAEVSRRERALGASRPSHASGSLEDALDRRLRESLYGIEPDNSAEKRKSAPVFEEIK
jgi:hypothetical protein